MKLQVQQKSIRLSRTIQPFPLQGVLAPNLCLLALLHSSPSDSPRSLQTRFKCNVLFMAALRRRFSLGCWDGQSYTPKNIIQPWGRDDCWVTWEPLDILCVSSLPIIMKREFRTRFLLCVLKISCNWVKKKKQHSKFWGKKKSPSVRL